MAEAICLVIDTGRTSSQRPPESPSFLEEALECAALLVERKLFMESKDLLGVVLFGSQETRNNLDYENIHVLERGLAQADWETVSYLREHVGGTDLEADWLDALVVALDFLKVNSEGRKLNALKIVLFSELGCNSDPDNLDLIIKGMNMLENIDLTHIGPGWLDDVKEENGDSGAGGDHGDVAGPSNGRGEPEKVSGGYRQKPRTEVQRANELIMNQLVNETDGMMCSLDLAVGQFLYKNKKGKRATPWKVCWEIGPEIRINTAGFVRVRRETVKSWKRSLARGGAAGEELKPETTYVRNNEEQELVEPEDIVSSYRYGPDMVIISPADEEAAKFEGGPKSMALFGFIARSEIQHRDLIGDGSMVFLPVEGDPNSRAALSALVQAMLEMDMVAVVRKVYSKASTPRLGVLVPESDENLGTHLAYIELPYSEEVRNLSFAPLPSPSDEQLSVVDDLIDAMMLEGEPNSGVELMRTGEMLNPANQYFYQAIRSRALEPGRVLPPPARHITDMLDLPSVVEEASRGVLDKMEKVFATKEVETDKKGKRTAEQVFGKDHAGSQDDLKKMKLDSTLEVVTRTVTEVGSVTPVSDFLYLVSSSVTSRTTLDMAAQQLETVVLRMLSSSFGSDMNTKVVSSLRAYREEAVRHKRPDLYNQFIRRVKEMLGGPKDRLWLDVAEANLGLISHSEVVGGVEEREADTFLLPPEVEGKTEEEEEEDMLDML